MKKLCVLQVTPEVPTREHQRMFNTPDCDFFFVTHDKPHGEALAYCPNTTWTETRNMLAKLVPKEYEYYSFIDYDYVMHVREGGRNVLDQMLVDLENFHPAVMTMYPGKGLSTPLAVDTQYRFGYQYTKDAFSHCGTKTIHKSLLPWFFPMIVQYGSWASCHFFNFQEIPYHDNVIMTHNIVYDNTAVGGQAHGNPEQGMRDMWKWMKPYMKLPADFDKSTEDSLAVKWYYFHKLRKVCGEISKPAYDNYFDRARIESVFDLSHPYFSGRF